jgi:hypothetical protein
MQHITFKQQLDIKDVMKASRGGVVDLQEKIGFGRASMYNAHLRPKAWKKDPKTGLDVPDYRFIETQLGPMIDLDSAEIIGAEIVWNQITNVGRVQLHKQGYDTTGLATNGFNYIALTNTAVTPAAGDTTLSGEIAANGLSRAQGTVTLASGAGNQTTISKVFTNTTANQAAQAAALFNAASVGTMNHELTFTQRSLIVGDTLTVTYTITLG